MANIEDNSNFLFYKSENGEINIQVILGNETVWLSINEMAILFGIDKSGISRHLHNIFNSKELIKDATVAKIATVQKEGNRDVNRMVDFYNLDAIISVGYRVNSYQATQFRKWSTGVLKAYLIKGFVLNNDRLKQGSTLFGEDYFDELLEKIREIRASERRFYQKITDLYATAIDYDKKASVTKTFFATVQNKMHWAIHGHTAAELIAERADSTKPNMGLTTWKDAEGKILKTDTAVAKNYLKKAEIEELNRVVTMYLDFAENMAKKRAQMKMLDWVERLDAFLTFNGYETLKAQGKITAKVAKQLAEKEYLKFRVIQDENFESDFDKMVGKVKEQGKITSK